ncbi:hypothetical protein ABN214_14940 [Proteus terrae]|uniref:hypothetical protein n=1 Tax=Proteus terrae TaxID=1574161 RepID=UPI0032DAE38A
MNDFDYNLETFKRVLTTMSTWKVTEKQANALKELRCNPAFEAVFGSIYEDKGIITERQLSELTNFKFSTYALVQQYIRDPNIRLTELGEVYIMCTPRSMWGAVNYNNQPTTVFIMLDEEPEESYDNVIKIYFIVDEKVRYTGYFVTHPGFYNVLIDALNKYVPENVKVVAKKS